MDTFQEAVFFIFFSHLLTARNCVQSLPLGSVGLYQNIVARMTYRNLSLSQKVQINSLYLRLKSREQTIRKHNARWVAHIYFSFLYFCSIFVTTSWRVAVPVIKTRPAGLYFDLPSSLETARMRWNNLCSF